MDLGKAAARYLRGGGPPGLSSPAFRGCALWLGDQTFRVSQPRTPSIPSGVQAGGPGSGRGLWVSNPCVLLR
jgi:hypothetical protein